ncbi:DUF4126 domain-containing protein [Rubrobacter tropicus]|uniref:DUF4126 domain-containing protein n=1 Tax=Rubrobacter tropicus TaxID=2653851 RepID=UPI0014096EF3|nr:DUF4126 domain-containing protein [Rubrobacter tropicus]
MKWARLRYNARVETALTLGLGIGIASIAGVRAFLPLVLVYYLSLPEGPFLFGTFPVWAVISALAILVVLESVLDKVGAAERVFNYVMVPIRVAAGALVFGIMSGVATISEAVPWLIAGAVIAGVVAVLKVLLRPSARDASSGVSTAFLSFIEDVIGLVGGVLALFVPYLPALLVAFLLFFFSRIRKRRGRKFGGLRILGD